MDPFAWLHDEQLVEADGIVFGPGVIWPSQAAAAPPATKELAATINGQAVILDASLLALHEIAGTSTGDSYDSADLSSAYELEGTSTGTSTVQGSLPIELAATVDGSASTYAALIEFRADIRGEGTIVKADLGLDRARLSRISLDVPYTNVSPDVRLSRISLDVPYTNTSPGTRLSRISLDVPYTTTSPGTRLSRISLDVLVSRLIEMLATALGDSYASADLKAWGTDPMPPGTSIGDSYVQGYIGPSYSAVGRGYIPLATLDNGFSELRADIRGDATVGAFLVAPDTSLPPYQPLNYPLGHGDDNNANLFVDIDGTSTTYGELETATISNASYGEGYTSAQLESIDPLGYSASAIYGDSYVFGEMYDPSTKEMSGTSTGDSYVRARGDSIVGSDGTGGDDIFSYGRHYYFYGNVITGFDPTDDLGYDQTFTDGNIVTDFARYMYQYVNVNVAFDYTDDATLTVGFVSQSYPDGDIIRDFARYKYQYVNLVEEDFVPGRLTVGPAPRGRKDLNTHAKAFPPGQEGR